MNRWFGIAMAVAGLGCAVHHREGAEGAGLAEALAASAVAGRAGDEVLGTCLDLAGIAGTVSGRGGWVASGTLETGEDGWRWSPAPEDRLVVVVAGGVTQVRCPRLWAEHGDHDVRCALDESMEVVSWQDGDERGGRVDGRRSGVELHLVRVGTAAPDETYDAIEGVAVIDGIDSILNVRQTLRVAGVEQLDRWIEDDFAIGGIVHRIDGAAITTGTTPWRAEGKVLRDGETVARLGLEPGPQVVWTLTATGARVVIASPP